MLSSAFSKRLTRIKRRIRVTNKKLKLKKNFLKQPSYSFHALLMYFRISILNHSIIKTFPAFIKLSNHSHTRKHSAINLSTQVSQVFFCQKATCFSKIRIFDKTNFFCQKSKCLWKIKFFLVKNKVLSKINFLSKIFSRINFVFSKIKNFRVFF